VLCSKLTFDKIAVPTVTIGGDSEKRHLLRLASRVMLNQQGFAVIYGCPMQLELDMTPVAQRDTQPGPNATATATRPSMVGYGRRPAHGATAAGDARSVVRKSQSE